MLLDEYLHEELNLITIQLGENAQDITTFESDFQYLIHYIKEECPKAHIIVIGDFWRFKNRDKMKETVCKREKVEYVNLTEIKDNLEYYCGLGTLVYDKYGVGRKVSHSGVAKHPNDKAMRYIAQKILQLVINE